jgi:adenosylcobinamide-phosphate synthase
MLPLGYTPGSVSPDPLIVLLLALAIDAVAGEMPLVFRVLPHPVKLIGQVIAIAEAKLNRSWRSSRDRTLRGAVLLVLMLGGALALGRLISLAGQKLHHLWLLELLLTAMLVAQRSLYDHVRAVQTALSKGGLDAGRQAVAMIVGRDPNSLDQHGVARAAIESCAENFSDAVVAPVFWYVVAGLPGLLAYKTVNTLDSMIGHRNERYREFGMVSARCDDLLNLIPARLSGAIIALAAALVPEARPNQALTVMLRDARHHRSPNAGWPEAAMAGALGLSLAGPRNYPGLVVNDRWIGDGRPQAEAADIGRALRVFVVACGITAGLVGLTFALR